ncbi:MAG: DUF177 domain-containing protein [candidate division WOR-3 bacterium]
MKNKKRRGRQFLILVSDLKEGKNDLEWSVMSEDLAIEDMIITGNIKVKMGITKSGDKLLISGNLNFRAEVTCAYCGKGFVRDFNEEFSSCYVKGDERKLAANLDLDDEEIDRVYYAGEFINLESLIRDTIILSLPIAPQCGKDS